MVKSRASTTPVRSLLNNIAAFTRRDLFELDELRATLHRVEEERNRALSAFASLKRDVEMLPRYSPPDWPTNEMEGTASGRCVFRDDVLLVLARHDPSVSLSEPPKPTTAGVLPGDWPEDFARDNGTDCNTCSVCRKSFFGENTERTGGTG